MSEISSRPRVQSIASGVVLPIAAGCAFLALGAIGALINGLSKAGKKALDSSIVRHRDNKLESIQSLAVVSNEFRMKNAEWAKTLKTQNGLDQVEAVKVATLAALSNSNFVIDKTATGPLKSSLDALCKANNVSTIDRLKNEILHSMENSHQALLEKTVTMACAEATLQAGFETVRTEQTASGIIRVIGTHGAGRSLVTEIAHDAAKELSITTETLGISDGSCSRVMDAFDRALEAQGVRTAVPVRKHKGGVLDLALATDFVRSKVTKNNCRSKEIIGDTDQAVQRARKLNQRSSQHIRR